MSIGKYSEATISRTDAFLDKFEDLRKDMTEIVHRLIGDGYTLDNRMIQAVFTLHRAMQRMENVASEEYGEEEEDE